MAQVNKILRSFIDGELWDSSDVYDIVNAVNSTIESNNAIDNEITIARDGKPSLHERINRDVSIVSQYSQNAANSASAAAQSEANALTYANQAQQSAQNAAISESNANNSKNIAVNAATQATTSEANAFNSATNASISAQNAANSEANALLYQNQANTYKEDSYKWANTDENIQVTDSLNRTGYSSYHYAKKARQSATNAAISEANALASANSASISATTATNASTTLTSYLNGTTMPNLSCDMVDGFHASLTPSANTIVPLNSSGILDLSTTYIKSDAYTFRKVDLTNATSDYMLQVGEEAIINFTNATSVPLRIATQSGTYYECHLVCSNTGGTSGGVSAPVYLNPNNTTYSNSFVYAQVYRNLDVASSNYMTFSGFECGWGFTNSAFYITNFVQYKNVKGIYDQYGFSFSYPAVFIFSTDWRDTATPWTSLGTITFPQLTSGYFLVRRLV